MARSPVGSPSIFWSSRVVEPADSFFPAVAVCVVASINSGISKIVLGTLTCPEIGRGTAVTFMRCFSRLFGLTFGVEMFRFCYKLQTV